MTQQRKFTKEKLQKIKSRFAGGESAIELAHVYGVSRQRIYELLRLADPVMRQEQLDRDRRRKRVKYWDDPARARRYHNDWYKSQSAVHGNK